MTNDMDGKIEDAGCQGRGVGSVIGLMGSVWMVLDIDAVSCRLWGEKNSEARGAEYLYRHREAIAPPSLPLLSPNLL